MGVIAQFLSGRRGGFIAAGILLSYAVLGLMPFRWNPPRWVVNGAYRTTKESLQIASDGYARAGAAPRWARAATISDSVKIRLRVRAFATSGPIFSYSDWAGNRRNVLVGQDGPDLVFVLRTASPPADTQRTYRIPGAFRSSAWRDIEVVVEGRTAALWLDGHQAFSDKLPERPLAGWQLGTDFVVMMANEVNGTRPWLGEIAKCKVEAADVRVDYLEPGQLVIPDRYAVNFKFNLRVKPELSWDNLLNFLFFVPFAFVLARAWGGRGAFVFAVVVCALASAAVEVAQFGFDRMPSFTDFLTNTAGSVVGALTGRWCSAALPSLSSPPPKG